MHEDGSHQSDEEITELEQTSSQSFYWISHWINPFWVQLRKEIFKPRVAVQLHKPGAFCWFGVTDRRTCWLSKQHRWTQRYVLKTRDRSVQEMIKLTHLYDRYGYHWIAGILHLKGKQI
ncbi:MAG: hypothetical protein VX696_00885 [Pseudomonadota bacterium]|nr:hypothetical protein [Pseudomonadota bacterium]